MIFIDLQPVQPHTSNLGVTDRSHRTQGTLTYQLNEQDEDVLQLVDDNDLQLAKKHGSEPLKITSTEVDTRDVFDHASAELAKHGLDAPSTELKKLLDVLQFAPRRLVKCGLAPPKALKNTLKGDEAEEPEDVYVVEMAEALAIEDKEADATLDDAALAAKLQAEAYHAHLRNATFCGAFPGDGWSGGISSAVFAGCVPVVVVELPSAHAFTPRRVHFTGACPSS